jgi:hypothetical protein
MYYVYRKANSIGRSGHILFHIVSLGSVIIPASHREEIHRERGKDGALMAGGGEGGWTNEVTEYNAWSWVPTVREWESLRLRTRRILLLSIKYETEI